MEYHAILELRAIKPLSKTIIRLFNGKDFASSDALKLAFEKEALRLNAAGYNIYYVMNPINQNFEDGSAGDKDIAYRDLLLIDIDKVGHKGQPSLDLGNHTDLFYKQIKVRGRPPSGYIHLDLTDPEQLAVAILKTQPKK